MSAYKQYMKLADSYFEKLKKGVVDSPEEQQRIQQEQDSLWEQMTDEEKIDADDAVLRTTIWINSDKKNE